VKGARLRAQGAGLRDQGAGLRDQGAGRKALGIVLCVIRNGYFLPGEDNHILMF
jgi:hypothetical protein